MASKFPGLKNHVIVCGFGAVGQKVTDVLVENNASFVIVELNPAVAEKIKELGHRVINGDATLSKVLREASIETAKSIAIVMDNDAKNLFCVLTARDMNKEIFIATRANDDFVREKLVEAGADYIVMPQKAASKEIVKELFKPA
ncbi:MAG: potassium channel family protein [Candidatus Micrarchaeales archaeon]